MNKNELHGTLVLVHPWLQPDPGDHRGKVGILTYVDNDAKIFVSFNDGEGKFASNALLQLKPRDELFPDLIKDAASLELKDFKDLYKISILQDIGRSTDIWRALEIAGKNPAIWDKALDPLHNRIPLKVEQYIWR